MATTDQILSRLRRTLQSIFRIGNIQIKDNSGVAEIRDSSDSAYANFVAEDIQVEGQLTVSDDSVLSPLNLTERSSPPSSPSLNDMYLDDGTNTASGKPNFFRYNGSLWEELGDGGSIDVYDGTTTVSPTAQLTFDSDFFTVTDEGGNEASVTLGASPTDFKVQQWVTLDFDETTANGSLILSPPAYAIIDKVRIRIDGVASGGSPIISIGTSIDNEYYVEETDVDLLTNFIYESNDFIKLGISPYDINLYITPDSQTFSGSVMVLYYTDAGAVISQLATYTTQTSAPLSSYPSGNQDDDINLSYTYAGDSISIHGSGTTDVYWGNILGNTPDWGQTFTTTNGGLFTEFTFEVASAHGSVLSDCTWYLYADNGDNTPNQTTILSTGTHTIVASSVNTVSVPALQQIILEANTVYWIVLDSGDEPLNAWWDLIKSTIDEYASGVAYVTNGRTFDNWTSQSSDLEMDVTLDSINVNDSLSQSFLLLQTSTIEEVLLLLKKVGTPTDTMTLRIETNNSGNPSATLAHVNATTTLAESSLGTSYGLESFTFSTSFELSAGIYWLVLTTTRSSSSTNYISWGANTADPSYDDGEMLGYYSSAWNTLNADAIFYINGITTASWDTTNVTTIKHVYQGLSASVAKQVVAIGDFGVYPSLRRRPTRTGVILESGILTGQLVEVATSGEVQVVCAENINAGDQLRPFYDETLEDSNGYLGRVIKWDGTDTNDSIDEDFGVMVAINGGTLNETITAILTDKNDHNDMRVFKLGEARLVNDTYLATVEEAFAGETFELGVTELGVTSYLTYRQL